MKNPHDITSDFEKALCEYTGAKYAVAVNSCTMALLLACAFFKYKNPYPLTKIIIPKRTYISVPMSIKHAGYKVAFRDEEWSGGYQLAPLPVYDFARYFTGGMYSSKTFQCVSFHVSKILGDSQGGAILHDNKDADDWFRKTRFDGRSEGAAPKDDHFDVIGWHCYMSPDVAARLLWKLQSLPLHNNPLPNDDYPDLSQFPIFKG